MSRTCRMTRSSYFAVAILAFNAATACSHLPLPHDTLIVRAILDANGLYTTSAAARLVCNHHAAPSFYVDLSCLGLRYIPPEIGELQDVRIAIINLYRNRLDSLPPEIGNLWFLEYLTLDENRIRVIPKSICSMRNLKSLSLSYNELDSVPAYLSDLGSLRDLSLAGNRLRSLPAELSELDSLAVLNLSGNRLTAIPSWVSGLKRIERMYFGGNQIQVVPENINTVSEHLVIVRLSYNRISRMPSRLAVGVRPRGPVQGSATLRQPVSVYLDHNDLRRFPEDFRLEGYGVITSLQNNKLVSLPAGLVVDTFPPAGYFSEFNVAINRLRTLPEAFADWTALPQIEITLNHICRSAMSERLQTWLDAKSYRPQWTRHQTCGTPQLVITSPLGGDRFSSGDTIRVEWAS